MLQGIVDYLPALLQSALGRGQLTGLPYDETCSHGEGFEESPVQGAGRRYRHEVQAGMVGVNIGVAAPVAFFPFSGWKDSFLGDLHAHGPDAFEFYTRKKTVTSRWFSSGQGSERYFVES